MLLRDQMDFNVSTLEVFIHELQPEVLESELVISSRVRTKANETGIRSVR